MSEVFKNIKLPLDQSLKEKIALLSPQWEDYRVLKKSIDARKKQDIHEVYTVEVFKQNESIQKNEFQLDQISKKHTQPIIIGSGPAGLFAAIRLIDRGIKPIIIERGEPAEKRVLSINKYWRYGKLNTESNVCFGEGGAGLYSDGKLITRIKSPYIPYVLNRLVKFGAPEEIEYLSNPHVGSDKLRRIIPHLRRYILSNGGECLFNSKVTNFIFENNHITGVEINNKEKLFSDHIVLATGHSASDIYKLLNENHVFMEGKSFALGLRIEHPQESINKIQYRQHYNHPKLHAANYKLTYHDHATNTGIYSFCMCPGGYILTSSTDEDKLVCNGMSNFNRNSPFANSGIVVTVDFKTHFKDTFESLNWRDHIENKAFNAVLKAGGTKEVPAQTTTDFMSSKSSGLIKSSSISGVVPTRLDKILPNFITNNIKEGLESFNSKMSGFLSENSQLHGVESRTSSPIRITRDKVTLESVSHRGLFPIGEGAGYAGGITSAAVDGCRVAEVIFSKISSQSKITSRKKS